MMRSKRFEPIREIASTSAQELSRAMGEAGNRVAELERQLEQLKTYRDEYVRNSTQANGTMDAVKLQNYRSFLDRLGEALRQHLTKLDNARVEYEKRRLHWSEKRIEAESLGRVVERFSHRRAACCRAARTKRRRRRGHENFDRTDPVGRSLVKLTGLLMERGICAQGLVCDRSPLQSPGPRYCAYQAAMRFALSSRKLGRVKPWCSPGYTTSCVGTPSVRNA